jgi:hypothetical protein
MPFAKGLGHKWRVFVRITAVFFLLWSLFICAIASNPFVFNNWIENRSEK